MNIKLKKYIIKSALISSIFIWALGSHLKDFTNSLTNVLIIPFLEIDLNLDGKSDITQIKKLKLKIGDLNFPIGELIKAVIELTFKVIVIYGIFLLLLNYSGLIK